MQLKFWMPFTIKWLRLSILMQGSLKANIYKPGILELSQC